jgi:hypothetical protein
MKAANIAIVLFLVIGAIVLSLWRPSVLTGATETPGQYPIGDMRYEWPVKERRRPYRPTSGMGSDAVVDGRMGAAAPAPKVVCALSDTCPEAL